MVSVHVENGNYGKKKVFDVDFAISGNQLMNKLTEILQTQSNYYFFKYNGHLVESDDIIYNGDVLLVPKLCGGKGGFGSMLRAIGAQIEKTTNREACRDLSGRRLRDINEEKRLKAWIEKQAKRDEEAAERKKKKLARLCAEPKHEFKDKSYEEQRSVLTERIEDAVEVGFAAASSSAIKRVANQDNATNIKKKKKTILDLDDDIDSDDLEFSDDSADEKETNKTNNISNIIEIDDSSDTKLQTLDSNNLLKKKIPLETSLVNKTEQTDDTSR